MPTITTLPVRFQTVDGVRIRYADSGGAQRPAILLTSPWPESVYAFTPMWPSLSERARVFAVDLPGFGGSERREKLLSPRAMGAFLVSLVAETGLEAPHVVAPDVGTAAALFAAADNPGLLASVVVGAALDTIAGGIPADIRADYVDCYAGDRFVESMRYVRSYPQELPVLADLLPRIDTPMTIIAARHDRVVPLANAEFLHDRLPASRLVTIDAGHFAWEEAPAEYAAIVLDSVTRGQS